MLSSTFRFVHRPVSYHKVPLGDNGSDEEPRFSKNSMKRTSHRVKLLLAILSVMNLTLVLSMGVLWKDRSKCSKASRDLVYSPARYATASQIKVFNSGFEGDQTIYQGPPSAMNNAAWETLYNSIGILRITEQDASQLVNKTVPIPGDPGHYVISLSVFHQLHCLNMIRKVYWSKVEYPTDHELMGAEHIDHCIDGIRQYIMCNADISPITWMWDPTDAKSKAVAQVAHTCQDFERIQTWAKEHELVVPFQTNVQG